MRPTPDEQSDINAAPRRRRGLRFWAFVCVFVAVQVPFVLWVIRGEFRASPFECVAPGGRLCTLPAQAGTFLGAEAASLTQFTLWLFTDWALIAIYRRLCK